MDQSGPRCGGRRAILLAVRPILPFRSFAQIIASIDGAIDRPAGEVTPCTSCNLISANEHDGSSLQRVTTSVLSKRSGVPQRAFCRSAFALRARRNAPRRYFRFHCRNRPSIERTDDSSRRDAANKFHGLRRRTRVGSARASIRTDEPRPKTHRGA